MKKWIKRLLLVVALLLSLAAILLTGGFTLLRGVPDYYNPARFVMTDAQRAAAAQSAEQTLARIQNLAADAHGAAIRAVRGGSSTSPTTRTAAGATSLPTDANSNTFAFTQDQLNALFNKWADLKSWRDKYEQYVENPVLILRPGSIILAGKVKRGGWDTVMSLHFEPKIDTQTGRLDLNLTRVLAGRLPVPQDTVIAPLRDRITRAAQSRLPNWRQRAAIEPNGWVNEPAVDAALAKDGVHILNDRPVDPILFIPVDGSTRRVPMRVNDLSVNDGSITLTVTPLSAEERTDLLARIREPLNQQTAMNVPKSADQPR